MLTPYMPQLKLVAQHHPSRTREFAFDAATAVATAHCEHAVHPLPLQAGLSLAQRKVAAKAHAGLCGVSLAAVIVGLQFSDISETATRRSVPVSYAVFRNQACFDASRELNAFGTGVQIKRKDCFAHACRALFPGNGLVEEWAETAFSS